MSRIHLKQRNRLGTRTRPPGNSLIKIVHITTVAATLGFLRGQLRYMQSRGFEVHVIAAPGDSLDRFAVEEGVAAHPIAMERRITPIRDLFALIQFVRRFRTIMPDIVHASTPKGGLLGTVAARMSGVPLVIYHVRGLPFTGLRGVQRVLMKTTERIACSLAHRVICVSSSVRIELLRERMCSSNKLVVLASGSSNGVDAENRYNPSQFSPEQRRSLREDLHIPPEARVVGFVGRLVRDKGVVELARAWTQIAQSYPDAWLLIVGGWESRDAVPQIIRDALGNHARVRMVGEQRDVARFYAMMDVVVLPTFREGFPNVPLEAAAMELPIVSTNVTGCTDAVTDGITGLLVPAQDSDALFQAISVYLDDSELRRQHGRAGRARVRQKFRPEFIWEALNKEYLSGLSEKGYFPKVAEAAAP